MGQSGSLTRFLKQCWTALRDYLRRKVDASRKVPIPSNELTNGDDLLGRFLLQKNHFKKAEGRATAEGFMPPPDLQLSVFLITSLSASEIWAVGKQVLDQHPQPRLYGRADVHVAVIRGHKLKALRDDQPPRHVTVTGWPSYADGKDLIKSIAQELARASTLTLLPAPMTK